MLSSGNQAGAACVNAMRRAERMMEERMMIDDMNGINDRNLVYTERENYVQ